MILFCGIPTEGPLERAIAAAETAELPHVVFNQREAHFSDMLLEQTNGRWHGALWVRETAWPLDQFTGIYTRLIDHRTLPEVQTRRGWTPEVEDVVHANFLHSTLAEWIELSPCRVLNKAEAMASNGSKPYQAQFIQRAGFLTPPTLVTNAPELVLEFAEQHGEIIYKSTSAVRSIVRAFDPAQRANLSRLRSLPTQFQKRITGTNIRVHVVGETLFATEIISEAVDYRYAGRDGLEAEMRPILLPDEIAARCIELSKALRLPLCGIDLMETADGSYYCFEVNPSPAYSYFEEGTQQPISNAIVDYLSLRAS